MIKRILLSGGGTGGHVYPALAIAKEVRKRYPEAEIAYMGTKQGMEAKIVAKEKEIQFYPVEVQGFVRRLSLQNVKTVLKFIRAIRDAKKWIQGFKPDVVVGTGGYVSGPAVYAAHRLGIPTLVHEQNVLPGLTTRFLSRFSDVIALSFPESEKYFSKSLYTIVTGNPRATEVMQASATEGRKSLHTSSVSKKVVLFLGGSQGAKSINRAVLEMIPFFSKASDTHFVYVTGEAHFDAISKRTQVQDCPNLEVRPFIYNMPEVLSTTYLVVGRAGASTLAELTALGIPSILIPSPYVTNNHQEANARSLEENKAAKVILDRNCTGETLWEAIWYYIQHPSEHQAMKEAAQQLGYPQAARVVVDELERCSLRSVTPRE